MNQTKLHHVAIVARDPETLADFYEELLGWERPDPSGWPVPLSPGSAWLTNEGILYMFERPDSPEDGVFAPERVESFSQKNPGFHLLSFRIEKTERSIWIDRLNERGIRIEHESAFTVYFRDPEGNRIGLTHFPEI